MEYAVGEVFLGHSETTNKDSENFVYLSHNYLYYNGLFFFSFKSQLGVSKYLLLQDSDSSVGLSYKNIITGIIPGIKYKYLNGIWGIIPEVSIGGVLDVISLWKTDDNSLIFFNGINLGVGLAYDFRGDFGLGIKFMYDIGYGNYMSERKARFTADIMTFMLTFDFYDK